MFKVKTYFLESIKAGEDIVIIDDSYYDRQEYSVAEKKLIDYYNELELHQRRLVTYVFGKESKRISKREWAELMNTGSDLITRINRFRKYQLYDR